jgi:hypothetical protein
MRGGLPGKATSEMRLKQRDRESGPSFLFAIEQYLEFTWAAA